MKCYPPQNELTLPLPVTFLEAPFEEVHDFAKFWLPIIGDIYIYKSGQIIATSHDLTPNGGLVEEIPLFQGNLGW